MAKSPAFQFYPGDWLRSTDLQMCSMTTHGVWINCLCHMWFSKTRGKLKGTTAEIMKIIGCTEPEWLEFLAANKIHNFATVTVRYKNVTVTNRRMQNEEKARQGSRNRQKRYRDGQSNKKVTSLSPTPSPSPKITSQDTTLATLLFTEIQKNDPNAKQPNYDTWTYDINKLHRIDKRSYEDIEAAIKWCQHDSFWCSNILSAKKLRKQFPKLRLQRTGTKPKPDIQIVQHFCRKCDKGFYPKDRKIQRYCPDCREKESV
ncbi:hypothetical protein LCGC14_1678180 [marine sediment metagenome]|uniref:Uncharacterized protein n=1 Tax=marine sediment metagenome TaxID=412755 RepID=A0A0F9IBT1_9ZZZZ